jgi:hypothetical protein
MIGTRLVEELVQAVALSHRVKGYRRCSLLMLAAPESGKTTIATAANCTHVRPIAIMSGRSILREVNGAKEIEFLLFNDLTAVRALSPSASNLLVVMLNQLTQDERGDVAFAGKEVERIERPVGVIGCLTFKTFVDHRARWKEMGFISRMIPFAYEYGLELIAEIKDAIDAGALADKAKPGAKMPRTIRHHAVSVHMNVERTRVMRRIADARAAQLGQLGIRLLQNYHALIRGRALLHKRTEVNDDDMRFLRAVDSYVSITKCTPLNGNHGKE